MNLDSPGPLSSIAQMFLQSYGQAKQLKRQGAMDEETLRRNKVKEQQDAEEIQQRRDRFNADVEHQREMLKLAHTEAAAKADIRALEVKKIAADMFANKQLKPSSVDPNSITKQFADSTALGQQDVQLQNNQVELGGQQFNTSEFGTAGEIGQAAYEKQRPVLDAKNKNANEIADKNITARIIADLQRQKAAQELAKQRQEFDAGEHEKNRSNATNIAQGHDATRMNAARVSASVKPTGNNDTDKLLTPDEAIKLNVPYGTTRSQAAGKTPQKPLTQAQQTKAAELDEMERNLVRAIELGTKTKWSQQQGFGGNAIGSIRDSVDSMSGSQDEIDYRQLIGEVFSEKALERGGKSFTPGEKKMLRATAVDLSHGKKVAPTRLNNMLTAIKSIRASNANMPQTPNDIGKSDDIEYGTAKDGTPVQRKKGEKDWVAR